MVSEQRRFCLAGAGLHGLMAISLGAFGAHGLKAVAAGLGPEDGARLLDYVDKGARYQLVHAAALLALASLPATPGLRRAAWALLLGPLLFSGSLYAMALGGPRWLGALTPLGGLGLLLGWGLLLAEAWRKPAQP